MQRIMACSVWVGMLLLGGAAAAEDVVPLVPKMDPPAAAERITQFHDALAQGLKTGGLSVTPAATVRARLKLPVESSGCDEGPCIQTNAALIGGSRFATAKVSSVGKNYTVEVRLFRGNVEVARTSGHCDICTNTEAVQTLLKAATDLGGKAEEPPLTPAPTPKVEPKPTPRARAKPVESKSVVVDQPLGPTPAPAKRRVWPLWPAILTAAAGVVGIAVGVPLIAIDGDGTNCTGEPRADKKNCKDLYSTAGGGWALTAMGVASLAASGVFFYLHFRSKPKEQPLATTLDQLFAGPLPEGGVALGAGGRF